MTENNIEHNIEHIISSIKAGAEWILCEFTDDSWEVREAIKYFAEDTIYKLRKLKGKKS